MSAHYIEDALVGNYTIRKATPHGEVVVHGNFDAAAYAMNALASHEELTRSLKSITEAYDKLLDAYGKPFGWGRIESDNARDTLAKAGAL